MATTPSSGPPRPVYRCDRRGCDAVCNAAALFHVVKGGVFWGYYCRKCVKCLKGKLTTQLLKDVPGYDASITEQMR